MNNSAVVVDSATLVSAMHQRGINLRYLGLIMTNVTNTLQKQQQQIKSAKTNEITSPVMVIIFLIFIYLYSIQVVLLREVIIRSAKQILNKYIENCKDAHLAQTIAALLNAFFGKLTPYGKVHV